MGVVWGFCLKKKKNQDLFCGQVVDQKDKPDNWTQMPVLKNRGPAYMEPSTFRCIHPPYSINVSASVHESYCKTENVVPKFASYNIDKILPSIISVKMKTKLYRDFI